MYLKWPEMEYAQKLKLQVVRVVDLDLPERRKRYTPVGGGRRRRKRIRRYAHVAKSE